jgi:putative tricarboxylic transport membrane protein
VSNRIGGGLTVLIGCAALWECIRLYPYKTRLLAGDHLMPGLLGTLLIVLGLALALSKPVQTAAASFSVNPAHRRIIVIVGVMFGFYFLMRIVGFIAGTAVVLVLLFKSAGSYRWRSSALLAAVFTLALDLVFVRWLHLVLPAGILFQRLGVN